MFDTSKYADDGEELDSATEKLFAAFGALSGLSFVAFVAVSVLFVVFGGWILIFPIAIIGLLGFIAWVLVASVLTYAAGDDGGE